MILNCEPLIFNDYLPKYSSSFKIEIDNEEYIIEETLINNYELKKQIGVGGFGIVFEATHKVSLKSVAIKFIIKSKLNISQLIQVEDKVIPKEIWLLKVLDHSNLIQYYEHFESSQFYVLVMELYGQEWNAQSYDLFEYLTLRKQLPEWEVQKIIKQLLNLIGYLEGNHIFHGDIKDENVLIDKNLNIKLIDLGSSIINFDKDKDFKVKSFNGTVMYSSPEIVNQLAYNPEKSDIWSIGILVYILIQGYAPFQSKEDILGLNLDFQNFRASEESLDFLLSCLQFNPFNRPSVVKLLNHPWLMD